MKKSDTDLLFLLLLLLCVVEEGAGERTEREKVLLSPIRRRSSVAMRISLTRPVEQISPNLSCDETTLCRLRV